MASNMRIGGLASGMDIDQIVKDLMKVERMPLDKLKQKKQLLEWQRDDYREMNKLLQELDTLIFDGVFKQSTFLKKTVTSSDESVVTAVATNVAANQTVELKDITQLASAARWTSETEITTTNGKIDPNAKLETITFIAKDSNGDVQNKQFTTSFSLKFEVIKPGSTTPEIVDITIDPTADTLNSVISKLNQNSKLGVSAFYDEFTGKLVITKNETGEGASIKVIEGASDGTSGTIGFLNALGFESARANNELTGKVDGQNAKFTINGLPTERTTNTFTINGMTYTLKNTKTSGTITISTTTDTDSIFNSIKAFVDKYNEVISKINAELKEERYRNYPPLTDEQKEAMTEKQIELWEEKARSGMLRGDSILSSGLSKMRMDLYTKVEGSNITIGFSQLAEIGITTSSNYLDGGKLIIDETKLRQKIQENPNAIYRLFNNDSTNYSEKGIVRRLRDTIKDTIGKIEQKAGKTIWTNQQFAIGRDLIQIDSQIDRFEDRLKEIEDRYWRQFTAMEKAIQRANEQSMYLMNAFFGGSQ
ncbi:flagellar hook-associated protein 2 [Parageobacillus toebii]|uniref:flagellar hook-associated protein 2 n=1 Tax=Parageobacillus toebii TaxID=153151 RepID=UPI001967FCE4|nr:flagellar hook-associated protein 2 [Parageobacillus toebii]QSB49482.1 flagellar hook-associated protein 2 [Parageobacillus toebii]